MSALQFYLILIITCCTLNCEVPTISAEELNADISKMWENRFANLQSSIRSFQRSTRATVRRIRRAISYERKGRTLLEERLSNEKQKRALLEERLYVLQATVYNHTIDLSCEKQLRCLEMVRDVYGDWSTWSSWSYCTKTCGEGERNRTRTCTNAPATNSGRACLGRSQDSDICNITVCPSVHGTWSTWGPWDDCTRTCGDGQRKRLRTCTNPPPTDGGRECVGDSQDIDYCNNTACLPPVLRHTRVIIGSGPGSGVDQFNNPEGVAVSPAGGRFYVVDSWNHRVKIYNDDGVFIKTFGTLGKRDGQFEYPTGIAVNSHEDIVIADNGNHRIVVCDRDGQFKYTFGKYGSKKGQLDDPWGVAVDRSDIVYVCDYGNNRVQVFTPTGEFIRQFGREGNAPGEISMPVYIAVAATTGRVYVTEHGNDRISVFTSKGEFIFTFGSSGEANGEMRNPEGIAIDEHGFVILADRSNNRLQVFHADGMFISTFGSEGVNNGQFKAPYGLAIMQNGDVIVTEYLNRRVQILSK